MDFPFDVQDLSVIVATDKTTLEVDLVQDQDEMSAITVAPFVEQTVGRKGGGLLPCLLSTLIG